LLDFDTAVGERELEIEGANSYGAGEFRSFDRAFEPYRDAPDSVLCLADIDDALERDLDLENHVSRFRARYAIRHAAVPGSVGDQPILRARLRAHGLAERKRYRSGEHKQDRVCFLHVQRE